MEKIPKFQPLKILSSRNFYKKIVGIMFVSLALLAGCRQKEVLPEPSNDAIDSATLAKIQAWYNPKVARLRGAKSTDIDIYLPQWGDGKLHTLPNGEKVALFPVHREKNVQYYDIGFVRRFAVRLSPTDSVMGVKLVEMIGNKTYLKDNKDILAKRYMQGDTLGWRKAVWSRDVPMIANNKSGKHKPCVIQNVSYIIYNSIGNCFISVTYSGNCGNEYLHIPIDCSDGGGSGGWNPPPPGGGGWNPPNNGGGGGGNDTGGAPVYSENPTCPGCPADSFDDPGDNTIPTTDKVTLDKTFKEDARAMCIYEKLKGNQVAMFNQITNAFKEANVELVFKADTIKRNGLPSNLRMGETVDSLPRKVIITLNKDPLNYDAPVKFAAVLLHEMLHAYWRLKLHQIGGYQNLNALPATGNNGMNTSNPDYADLKKAYNDYPYDPQEGHNVPHHNLMATPKYRQKLAQGIFEWAQNTGAGITQEECYALTQEGLMHDYVAFFAPFLKPNPPTNQNGKLIKEIYFKSRAFHCQ